MTNLLTKKLQLFDRFLQICQRKDTKITNFIKIEFHNEEAIDFTINELIHNEYKNSYCNRFG